MAARRTRTISRPSLTVEFYPPPPMPETWAAKMQAINKRAVETGIWVVPEVMYYTSDLLQAVQYQVYRDADAFVEYGNMLAWVYDPIWDSWYEDHGITVSDEWDYNYTLTLPTIPPEFLP